MYSWVIFLVLFIGGLLVSVLERMKYYRPINASNEIKISPISLALQELIAVSGGIYLSLVMLISFLKLDVPEKILIFDFYIDPIAFLSITLSIIQPFFVKLFYKNNKG